MGCSSSHEKINPDDFYIIDDNHSNDRNDRINSDWRHDRDRDWKHDRDRDRDWRHDRDRDRDWRHDRDRDWKHDRDRDWKHDRDRDRDWRHDRDRDWKHDRDRDWRHDRDRDWKHDRDRDWKHDRDRDRDWRHDGDRNRDRGRKDRDNRGSEDSDSDEDDPPEENYTDDPNSSGLKYWTVDQRKTSQQEQERQRPFVPEGEMWTDTAFPLPVAIKEYAELGLHWKRPHEIVPDPVLFSEGTSRFDIYQRNFGTCWFLSMMSNLAEKPHLCRKVINENSYTPQTDGVCHCRLWRFGEWEDVYMDDHLPVSGRQKRYRFYGAMSGTDSSEMWVSLLEKSLARLHGSYNVVSDNGGFPSDAYITLTGGVAERVSLHRKPSHPYKLFSRIKNALQSGALITCAVPSKFDGHMGLVGGHAYSLTGASLVTRDNDDRVPLVRIRNPHGTNEWTGDWSDKSDAWQTVKEGRHLLKDKNDGEFWMCLEDFLQYYVQTTICSLTPDFDIDGRSDSLNHVLRIFGEWRGRSAVGEGRSLRDRLQNPRFQFTVPDEGTKDTEFVPLVIQLIQKAVHLNYDLMRCDLYRIYRGDESSKVMYIRKVEDAEEKEFFFPTLQCSFRYRLSPGKYIVVPATQHPGINKEFLIRIFASCPLMKFRSIPRRISLIPR